jgi:iron complex transport system permease protein
VDSLDHQILLELRIPRMSTAFITGALLGIAGALMQVLLRNPLADPYILGVSGGASVAALLAIMAGASGMMLSGSAFAGALLSTLLVFTLAHGRGNWDSTRLLLTGVVLAAGWGAVSTQLHGMLFWLMGDLGFSRTPLVGSLVLLFLLPVALAISPSLNLLARGELPAASLGVTVGRLRTTIYVLASLATASAVTQAGNIGFVGLIAPHMLRLLGARDHRLLIPGVALLGGTLLLLADALSRLIIEPRHLPVGVLTALLGVPLFLLLLFRSRQLNNE